MRVGVCALWPLGEESLGTLSPADSPSSAGEPRPLGSAANLRLRLWVHCLLLPPCKPLAPAADTPMLSGPRCPTAVRAGCCSPRDAGAPPALHAAVRSGLGLSEPAWKRGTCIGNTYSYCYIYLRYSGAGRGYSAVWEMLWLAPAPQDMRHSPGC